MKLSKFASVRNHIIYLADCLLNDSLDNHDDNYYFTIFLLMKSLAKEICCFRSCAFFKLCTTIFGMFNEWIFWNRHLDFILLQVRSKTLSPHDGMYGNSENNSSPALSLVIDLIIFYFYAQSNGHGRCTSCWACPIQNYWNLIFYALQSVACSLCCACPLHVLYRPCKIKDDFGVRLNVTFFLSLCARLNLILCI